MADGESPPHPTSSHCARVRLPPPTHTPVPWPPLTPGGASASSLCPCLIVVKGICTAWHAMRCVCLSLSLSLSLCCLSLTRRGTRCCCCALGCVRAHAVAFDVQGVLQGQRGVERRSGQRRSAPRATVSSGTTRGRSFLSRATLPCAPAASSTPCFPRTSLRPMARPLCAPSTKAA